MASEGKVTDNIFHKGIFRRRHTNQRFVVKYQLVRYSALCFTRELSFFLFLFINPPRSGALPWMAVNVFRRFGRR